MEYIYGALLLHRAKQKIDEASLKKVLEAAGVKPDDARVKATVAALDGVDIEKAIETAAMPVAQAAAPAPEAKKEEKKPSAEEQKKSEEAAAAGLGALFG